MNKLESVSNAVYAMRAIGVVALILIHTEFWLIQSFQLTVGNFGLLGQVLFPAVGAINLMLPMVAFAGIRLYFETLVSIEGRKAGTSKVLGLLLVGAVIESVKRALMFGWHGLFYWNTLHCLALSFVILELTIFFFKRLGFFIALAIILATPFFRQLFSVTEKEISRSTATAWQLELSKVLLTAAPIVFLALLGWYLWTSRKLPLVFRRNLFLISSIVAGILTFKIFHYSNFIYLTNVIRLLGPGILVGTQAPESSVVHMWGIFPWTGQMMLGYFLVEGALKYFDSLSKYLGLIIAATFAGATVLFVYSIKSIITVVSSQKLLIAKIVNSDSLVPVLSIAFFVSSFSVFLWLSNRKFDFKFVKKIGQPIFWVYLFQTSMALYASQICAASMSRAIGMFTFLSISLVGSILIILAIANKKYQIKVRLR